MRPTTASKNKNSRPATGAKEAHGAYEATDMMISGKELAGSTGQSLSNKNLPRYKSVKMHIATAEDGKDESNNAGKGARGGAKDSSAARGVNAGSETPKSSGAKHASQMYPRLGVHGTNNSTKKDSANGQSTAHQPRQKRQSMQRPASNAKPGHGSGATGS